MKNPKITLIFFRCVKYIHSEQLKHQQLRLTGFYTIRRLVVDGYDEYSGLKIVSTDFLP